MPVSITPKAINNILVTMKSVGLDPGKDFLYVKLIEGRLSIAFVREDVDYPDEYIEFEDYSEYDGLKVINVKEDVVIDWAVVNGKQGIVIK